MMSSEEKMEADGRSIYVGNVDYGATAEELKAHFYGCGPLNRVSMLCNNYTDFAYIEFADEESARTATLLDESPFRGRQIKVCAKRPNRRGISTKGCGFRARDYSGYTPKGRGWAFRGRGRTPAWYPYILFHHPPTSKAEIPRGEESV